MNETVEHSNGERERPPSQIGRPLMLTAHPKFRRRSEPDAKRVIEIQPVKAGTPPAWLVDEIVKEQEWGVPVDVVEQIVAEQEYYADFVEAIVAEQEGRPPEGRLELLPE